MAVCNLLFHTSVFFFSHFLHTVHCSSLLLPGNCLRSCAKRSHGCKTIGPTKHCRSYALPATTIQLPQVIDRSNGLKERANNDSNYQRSRMRIQYGVTGTARMSPAPMLEQSQCHSQLQQDVIVAVRLAGCNPRSFRSIIFVAFHRPRHGINPRVGIEECNLMKLCTGRAVYDA